MATCPKCNTEGLDEGKPCPHCSPESASAKKKFKLTRTIDDSADLGIQAGRGKVTTFNLSPKLVGIIIAVVVVVGLVAGIFSGSDETDSRSNSLSRTGSSAPGSYTMEQKPAGKQASEKAMTADDEIYEVFAAVSQANLDEDIDQFMHYYADSFANRSEKQQKTLETWGKYDFLSLDFFVYDLDINDTVANASVAWEIALQELGGEEPRLMETTNQVVMEKGRAGWQIVKLD